MRRLLAVAGTALFALPGAAIAHEGNPNFRSDIIAVTPRADDVTLDVLNGDDRLELVNGGDETVVIYGYNEEPYARILADGTVQVNRDSPATYLNADRYQEGVKVPPGVTGEHAPRWKLVDRTGRFEWHDHRIHYMAKGTPPQVKDTGVQSKVFDWTVPLRVGAAPGAIRGVLLWVPDDSGGPPLAAIAGFVVLLLGGIALVVVTRRRRRGDAADAHEAW